jgi:DNA polymerase elongation subunit (family B)
VQSISTEVEADAQGVQRPAVELYGITAAPTSRSVCVRVYNFHPYLLVRIPIGCPRDTQASLCALLERYLASKGAHKRFKLSRDQPLVVGFSVHENCRTIVDYSPPNATMWLLRIELAVPGLLRQAQQALDKGHVLPNHPPLVTFEADVGFLERAMVDLKLYGCQWVTVAIDADARVPNYRQVSRCQLEYRVKSAALAPLPTDSGDAPPLRCLYMDIECPAQPDANGARFPTAQRDAITHISLILTEMGRLIYSCVLALVRCVLVVAHVEPLNAPL